MEHTKNYSLNHLIRLALCLPALLFYAHAQNDWQLKKDDNGINVYTKSSESSPIKSIRATLEFDVPLSAVLALVSDICSYHTWVYKCKQSTVIKQISPTSAIFHHVTEAPWPFDNRDHVSVFEITKDDKTGIVTVKSHVVSGVYPEQKGYVRLKKSQAGWIFTPVGDNKVLAVYELSFDPEGNIPAWLINLFITEGPYQSLSKMKVKVHEENYMNAAPLFKK